VSVFRAKGKWKRHPVAEVSDNSKQKININLKIGRLGIRHEQMK
jgi:hypothetical protein